MVRERAWSFGAPAPLSARRVVAALAGLMVAVVTMQTWVEAAVGGGAIAGVALLTVGRKVGAFWARLRPFFLFGLIAVVFGGLGGDDPAISLGPISWGYAALQRAGIAAVRLIVLGAAVSWMTLYIGTTALLGALWGLSRRVKRVGVDLSPVLIGLAVAIRFLPLLQQEAARLRLAWDVRGADLLGRSPIGRTQYAVGLIVPILAAALRRAETFAVAVDLRTGMDKNSGFTSPSLEQALAPSVHGMTESGSFEQSERDGVRVGAPTSMHVGLREGLILCVAWMPVMVKILWVLR